jgi:hypothetical protein
VDYNWKHDADKITHFDSRTGVRKDKTNEAAETPTKQHKPHGEGTCTDPSHDHSHGHSHDDSHGHHHHGTDESLHMSLAGLLSFLRTHATFPAEVPAPTLADRWRHRDLFPSVAEGLAALQEIQWELKQRVAQLEKKNAELRTKLKKKCSKAAAPSGADVAQEEVVVAVDGDARTQ